MMFENSDGALDFDYSGFRSIRMIINRNPDKDENLRDDWFGSRFDEISDVYLDKKLTEYPYVKLIDCCRENSCSVVKDIVIDEGPPLKDKILLESGNNEIDGDLSKEINKPESFDSEKLDFSNKISLVLGDLMEKDEESENDTDKVDRRSTLMYAMSEGKTGNENGRINFESTLDFDQKLCSSIDEISYACSVLDQSQDSASVIDDTDLVACSNGASFRSNSSSMSNRSFAFPILQSEWNSSPVRMAKADRRQSRKVRGWRQGLFCCRF